MNPDLTISGWIGFASASLTSLLGLVYILVAFYQHHSRTKGRAQVSRGVTLIARSVGGLALTDHERKWLRKLAEDRRLEVFHRLEQILGGDSRRQLETIGRIIGLDEAMTAKLVHGKTSARLQAVRYLRIVYDFDEQYLNLLRDPDPWVRTEVVEWAGNKASVTNARAVLGIFTSDDHFCRAAAQDSLVRIGQVGSRDVEAALRSTLDVEQLDAILFVARFLHDPFLRDAISGLLLHGSSGVKAGAARALGAIGTDAARDSLITLLSDQEPRVRCAAALALADLFDMSAAVAIVPLLDDTDWNVRSAAATALKTFGATGRVLLQDYLNRGGNRPDAAQQALDVSRLDQILEAA